MAYVDSTASLLFSFPPVKDDSVYVEQALFLLEYTCPFSELNVHQMRLVLACAQMIKKNDGLAEFGES